MDVERIWVTCKSIQVSIAFCVIQGNPSTAVLWALLLFDSHREQRLRHGLLPLKEETRSRDEP